MTKKDETVENRIIAAETLAYLIANSASLQRIAAISNHLFPSMASFLVFENSESSTSNSNHYSTNFYFNKYQQQLTLNRGRVNAGDLQENLAKRMRQAAFRVSI